MTKYVAGFLFDTNFSQVVLVRKNRPRWQAGKLNGVGGHVEKGETGREAMTREFLEEAGLKVYAWDHFCTLRGFDFEVQFFRAESTLIHWATSKTEEEIGVYTLEELRHQETIPNLSWLIPLASPANRHDWPLDIREKAAS